MINQIDFYQNKSLCKNKGKGSLGERERKDQSGEWDENVDKK